jgi:hypothetical protein
LAPDVFLRLGSPDVTFDSWKTWERGAPELAVEIVSDSDASEAGWNTKLERYHALGIRELVRFDADAPAGERIRVWDRIDGDLVERAIEGDRTPCTVLDLTWCIAPIEEHAAALRLDDLDGTLVPSPVERERRRANEALARIADLEAELAHRKQ